VQLDRLPIAKPCTVAIRGTAFEQNAVPISASVLSFSRSSQRRLMVDQASRGFGGPLVDISAAGKGVNSAAAVLEAFGRPVRPIE